MPTYDYECRKCGTRIEVFHGMTERPRKRCPACKGAMVRLMGTGAGIIFKGSGFYETDYKKKSGSPTVSSSSSSSAAKDTGSGSTAKPSETKKPSD